MAEHTPVERLRDTITERLDATRTLLYWAQHTSLTLTDPRLLGKEIPGWHDWPDVERLAEWGIGVCERDLRVLDRHAAESISDGEPQQWMCMTCLLPDPCPDLADMADVHGVDLAGGTDG